MRESLEGAANGAVIEEYPDCLKGPCILILKRRRSGNPVDFVWGIPKGLDKPAVRVTAYRPHPEPWDENFLRRRKKMIRHKKIKYIHEGKCFAEVEVVELSFFTLNMGPFTSFQYRQGSSLFETLWSTSFARMAGRGNTQTLESTALGPVCSKTDRRG